MNVFNRALLGGALALSGTFAMLAYGVATPAAPGATYGFTSAAALPALADEDDGDKGKGKKDKDCVNPAGHEKGSCKGHDNDDRANCKKHDRDDCKGAKRPPGHSARTISGTVLGVNGNQARVRLDNGQVITVNENGTALNVGQHYSLNGCYQGSIFVLGCYANGSNPPGGNNRQIRGNILSVNGNSLTLVGLPPVTINIGQALASGRTNGGLVLGRSITAYGYYQNGTFFATAIR
ncbi:MAG: hypothetical protein GIW95_03990 [Candidatus Eremiobacteraeota bacterium]|nr:hypothetical protein [Candidatus Eremiobacteraeota bacterium]